MKRRIQSNRNIRRYPEITNLDNFPVICAFMIETSLLPLVEKS